VTVREEGKGETVVTTPSRLVYHSRVVDAYHVILDPRECRAYSPGTHARKEEDGLLLEFPCNPIRTRSV
jgi:hypothetical protein